MQGRNAGLLHDVQQLVEEKQHRCGVVLIAAANLRFEFTTSSIWGRRRLGSALEKLYLRPAALTLGNPPAPPPTTITIITTIFTHTSITIFQGDKKGFGNMRKSKRQLIEKIN